MLVAAVLAVVLLTLVAAMVVVVTVDTVAVLDAKVPQGLLIPGVAVVVDLAQMVQAVVRV
jgi:hypothetical protein